MRSANRKPLAIRMVQGEAETLFPIVGVSRHQG